MKIFDVSKNVVDAVKAVMEAKPILPPLEEKSPEQIDELKKSTVANYVGAASVDKSFAAHDIGKINQIAATDGTTAAERAERERLNKRHGKRSLGIAMAVKKLAKEEVVDEANTPDQIRKKLRHHADSKTELEISDIKGTATDKDRRKAAQHGKAVEKGLKLLNKEETDLVSKIINKYNNTTIKD
jgi:hypothetical protein